MTAAILEWARCARRSVDPFVAGALRAFEGEWRTRLPMKDSAAARAAVPKLAAASRGG